ncbi:MAG: hypothetical protein ACM359_00990 [Bacillota bacterium]
MQQTNPTEWQGRCPAHDDGKASLCIGQGEDGRALLKCQAGCTTEAVLQELGLSSRDLFPPKGKPPRSTKGDDPRRIVEEYRYRERDGELLYEVVRYEPKDFRQRRPDGKGGWIWDMREARRVLYRLPELIAANPEAWVFVAEGEKDVERLARAGLTATCNVGGAGKWLSEYNEDLRNRRVCIIADKDTPGRKHAAKVAKSLHGIARDVRVLEMPGEYVKDVSDWFDAGGTAEELTESAEQAPSFDPTQAAADTGGDAGEGKHEERGSQSQTLVDLAAHAELFHDGDTGYATIAVADSEGVHRETHALRGKQFRLWLSRQFWEEYHKAPGSQAMQDALAVLEGKAMYEGLSHPVAVRIARHEEAIYLDLGNERWEAVKITREGWNVEANPSVRFVRRRGMQALPRPVRGGSISELRPLINASEETIWVLAVAWLVSAFRPQGPYPILIINGEQGTAKTTLGRMMRGLVDPNEADLRAAPKDDRDLMIAATNSWVPGFDNLSTIPPALSDSLCRLATGGGFATRELYADDQEKLFNATRPLLINGIEDLATRPDLLERSIVLSLPPIPEEARKSESGLWREYERVRPRVLGAILDAVAEALANLPTVTLARRPRMADFAEWIVAAEPALPWPAGEFLRAYGGNSDAAVELAIEASAIGPAILALMEKRQRWQGTATDLMAEFDGPQSEYRGIRQGRCWPQTPRAMSGSVRRIAPALRRLGIKVVMDDRESGGRSGGKRSRLITLERVAETPSPSSPPSLNRVFDPENADSGGRYGDGAAAKGDGMGTVGGRSGDGRAIPDHPAISTDSNKRYGSRGTMGTVGTVETPSLLTQRPKDEGSDNGNGTRSSRPMPPRYTRRRIAGGERGGQA